MLGRQHFTLSVATGFILVTPLLADRSIVAVPVLLGIAIGSLIPDIDASDATVFHTEITGVHGAAADVVNGLIGPFLPVFGYLTKYMVYRPSVFILNLFSENYVFEEGHRSFTHSITGVVVMTSATGFLLWPVLRYTGFEAFYLLCFLAGYMTGAFLHMLQDSFTKTGIAWNQPFSSLRLKGDLRTGKDNKRPRIFFILLLAVGSLNLKNIMSSPGYQAFLVQSLLLPAVCWTFFAWLSGLEIDR